MRKKEVNLRTNLTSHQLRSFKRLIRCLDPLEVERIVLETGDVDCIILWSLDHLQHSLSRDAVVDVNRTDMGLLPVSGRAGKKTLKGLEAILRAADALDEFKDNI